MKAVQPRFLWIGFIIAIAVAAYAVGRWQQVQVGLSSLTHEQSSAPASGTGSVAEPTQPDADTASRQMGGVQSGQQRFAHYSLGDLNVKALLLDGDVVWIGTSAGLVRFDARQGTNKVYDNRSGLLSNGVFYLGRQGSEVWIGTYGGGLSILDTVAGTWRNYNIPQGLADAFVYDVLKTKSGDIWFATWSGANRVLKGALDDPTMWELYTVENTKGGLPNDWVYGLAEGKNGEVWFATEGGLARYADNAWQHWSHAEGLGAAYETVAGDIQFNRDPGQVSQHHARQKEEQGLKEIGVAYNPNYVVALALGADGTVWAGTWGGGLSSFDGSQWRTYTTKNGLPANHVFALTADQSGQIWVGTSRGIARFRDGQFTTFGTVDGLFSDAVFAIEIADDGNTWIGSYGGVAWFPHGIGKAAASTTVN